MKSLTITVQVQDKREAERIARKFLSYIAYEGQPRRQAMVSPDDPPTFPCEYGLRTPSDSAIKFDLK